MIKRFIGDYHFLADKTTGITMRWGKSVTIIHRLHPYRNWLIYPSLITVQKAAHSVIGIVEIIKNG